jgi:RimJ/RimL family protein N-acetyltransferase
MINGERIYLRLPEKEDIKDIYNLINDEENRNFIGQYRPFSFKDEEDWVEKCAKEAKNGTSFGYVIVEKKTQKLIGTLGFNKINYINRVGDMGITIKKEFQNKGYGPEAIKLLLKWGFESLNLNLIIIGAIANNDRSIHVYGDKLKFKLEAKMRDRFYKKGKYYDYYEFSMSKEEYEEMYRKE